MNPSHHFRFFLAIYCLVLLSGCSAPPIKPNQTAEFYSPATSKYYPPKPDGCKIPILAYPPKQKYEVIGRFTMRLKFHLAEDGGNFMNKAARFNARRVGADAVLVVERWQEHPRHYYTYPEDNTDSNVTDDVTRQTSDDMYFDAKMIVYK